MVVKSKQSFAKKTTQLKNNDKTKKYIYYEDK